MFKFALTRNWGYCPMNLFAITDHAEEAAVVLMDISRYT